MLLGKVLLREGAADRALDEFDRAIASAPAEPEHRLVKATALLGLRRFGESRAVLQEILSREPAHSAALLLVALSAFSRALAVDPANLSALELSARTLASQRKNAEAIALVEKHVRTAGESAGARMILGRLLAGSGDRAAARRELERAVELEPQAVEAYMLLSALHTGADAAQQALQDLDKAVKARPRSLQAWMLKGTLHESLGQVYEAEEAYRKVLEIRPDFVPALNNLAFNLAEHGGNVDEALKFASKASELAPKVAGVSDTLGWIYVKKGVFAKAVTSLEAAVRGLPDNPLVHYHLGKAYAGAGDRAKALTSLTKALKLSPKFPGADDARKVAEELRAGGKG